MKLHHNIDPQPNMVLLDGVRGLIELNTGQLLHMFYQAFDTVHNGRIGPFTESVLKAGHLNC